MKIKLKRLFLILPIFILLSNPSFANTSTSGKYFALHKKGYERKTGEYSIVQDGKTTPIVKIVETNPEGTVEKLVNEEEGIYSLKNGGEIVSKNSYKKVEQYNEFYNLDDYDSINDIYKLGLPKDKENYNELMWVLNNICITKNELSKQALLIMSGLDVDVFRNVSVDGYEPEEIEQDIIETVQQAAIWYFANEGEGISDNTIELKNSNAEISNQETKEAINKLYSYLIEGAKSAVKSGYTYSKETKRSPIVFEKDSAVVSTVDNNYVIGPYKVSAISTNCTLQVSINNGISELQDVKLLGPNRQDELSGNNITEKIVSNLGQDFYIVIPTTTSATNIKINVQTSYNAKELTYWSTSANKIKTSTPIVIVKNKTESETSSDSKTISKPKFDLSLKQFVTTVNEETPEKSREPDYRQADLRNLVNGSTTLDNGTTLSKKSIKDGLSVNTGDKVVLTIRVYNEGQVDGVASLITEHLPNGVELVPNDESETNTKYGWKIADETGRTYTTDYLKDKTIQAFNLEQEEGKYKLDHQDIQIECKITAETITTDTSLKIIAEISESKNQENLQDRDSVPNNISGGQLADYNPGTSSEGKGYEDDDDYEELVIRGKYFDLALRSFISEVYDRNDRKAEYKREPKVDIAPLQSGETTAHYSQSKGPVSVEIGSTIVYTIRVYNEGQIDGFADEIVEHLPEELEFVNDEFNAENGWIIDELDATQRTLKTSALSKDDDDNIVKARENEEDEIHYKEIKLKCKVKPSASAFKEITTITEITNSSNSANLADRDNKANVSIPSDNDLANYKGDADNKAELTDSNYYYRGQEDDDDFDKIILEKFDLSLRSFISNVNNTEITDRIPQVDTSEYDQTSFNYKGNKDELKLCQNDLITLTIRVYNEGTQDGYAIQIGNDIPDGLEFVADNEINQKYKWKVRDGSGNETEDISEGKYLTTSYLAKTNDGTYDNLIEAYTNGELKYKEVKVVFKVTLDNSAENRIIETKSQIIQVSNSDGEKVSDVDSSPNNWIDGEDDQDIEKLYVQYFDLSLRMIVDETITIENGNEKGAKTSHNIDDEKEPAVNVTITKSELENTVVKFKYKIKIINEGEMEGTVTEISDYVPDGLRFNQADNIKWKETNGKIVTDQLKGKVIEPGQAETIDLILTWINDESNVGQKINIAEISDYKNEANADDRDSEPNNKKENEDDYASSTIIISSFTTVAIKYAILIFGGLVIVGLGALIIKKYVL